MQEMIVNRLRELLASGDYAGVIGWSKGETPFDRTPGLFTEKDLDRLCYDSFCGSNLSKYLIANAKDKKVIALLKPCDCYSFNQMCTEHRIQRENVYVIGVGCKGKIDGEKIRNGGIKGITGVSEEGDLLKIETLYGEKEISRKDVLLDKCLSCKGKEHKCADEVIGESEDTSVGNKYELVEKLDAMTPEERFEFWRGELSKCIRCNACRNACPACSCIKCVFDNPKSGVENKAAADDFEENLFHIIRAYHVAGRCTDCGECSRACPQGIPLHLLNRKIIKDINELYGDYQAGEEIGQRHPLTDFTFEDDEPSVVERRGGGK
ncbi:MAG: 4Fe-4S dicluster domain-containing protein [Clostridia bacterium]|nr:4Fe-4S dicluster domain-containing protein [Clostridia bacterium]